MIEIRAVDANRNPPGTAAPQSKPQIRRPLALATALIISVIVPAVGSAAERVDPRRSTGAHRANSARPNVLIILTDDVGFGASSTFGGPIPTPTFDALARNGLRYNRFTTAAICSPTRAALLTGRNPHKVGMGSVTNFATRDPGYSSVIPKTAATMASALKAGGYNTAMFGKHHLIPEWETSQSGPFDRWPTGLGFEYFYGFLSADTSQWAPSLVENTRPVEPTHGADSYFLESDLADRAIQWIREQHVVAPDKPFMVYYAPGAAHGPLHAPPSWLARFRGAYDMGWDQLREETFARQKAQGIIPQDAVLTPRPASIPAWAELSSDQKDLYSRQMEAYAALLSFSDLQIGRIISTLSELGELDNTLVVYMQGDNGASAEGGPNGAAFEQSVINQRPDSFDYMASRQDEIGGPGLYNLYSAGWASAMNTPFSSFKQDSGHFGGIRTGMVISWPARIKDTGSVRSQYAFITDIMPTILEASGIPIPRHVDGFRQQSIDGISLTYSFISNNVASRRRSQIYETMENYGIYRDGWFAGVLPKRNPWEAMGAYGGANQQANQRTWQLYNIDDDFSQSNDLAAEEPDRLRSMQAFFRQEARKNNIREEYLNRGREGVPVLSEGRVSFDFPDGVTRVPEAAAPRTVGRSFRITADIVIKKPDASGVVVAQGGRYGGFSLYFSDGRPEFHYNAIGGSQFVVQMQTPLPVGAHRVSLDFAADSATPGTAGTATILVDGVPAASARIGRTLAAFISLTEGLDIGQDTVTSVSDRYSPGESKFDGIVNNVNITLR